MEATKLHGPIAFPVQGDVCSGQNEGPAAFNTLGHPVAFFDAPKLACASLFDKIGEHGRSVQIGRTIDQVRDLLLFIAAKKRHGYYIDGVFVVWPGLQNNRPSARAV